MVSKGIAFGGVRGSAPAFLAMERSALRAHGNTLRSPPMQFLLGAIAAHLHFAPAPAAIFRGVEKQPAAAIAGALLDPPGVASAEQIDRRERDGAEDGGTGHALPSPYQNVTIANHACIAERGDMDPRK